MGIEPKCYVLEGTIAVPEPNVEKWGENFFKNSNVVTTTEIGNTQISTIFLGLDHNFFDEGDPLLFETMVFGGIVDGEIRRYSTWDDAEKGHAEMVALVKRS